MKKIIIAALIVVLLAGIGLFVHRKYIRIQDDPYSEAAQQIYNVERTLKEVDESWAYSAVTKVTPYTYADAEDNTIIYYCCQTSYVGDVPDMDGLNTTALGLVIDFTAIENRRPCEVNGLEAFQCEMNDRTYLCWTLSPEISCVIEYNSGTDETDIFRMAESVQLPDDPE